MSKKKIAISIGILLVILVLILVFFQKKDFNYHNENNNRINTENNNINSNNSTTSSTTIKNIYTLKDVSEHKNPENCWTIIDGQVYNLTSWIARHPGGDKAILSTCGIDASQAFNGQHGGKAKILKLLSTFKIGDLSNN